MAQSFWDMFHGLIVCGWFFFVNFNRFVWLSIINCLRFEKLYRLVKEQICHIQLKRFRSASTTVVSNNTILLAAEYMVPNIYWLHTVNPEIFANSVNRHSCGAKKSR